MVRVECASKFSVTSADASRLGNVGVVVLVSFGTRTCEGLLDLFARLGFLSVEALCVGGQQDLDAVSGSLGDLGSRDTGHQGTRSEAALRGPLPRPRGRRRD